MIQGGVGNKRGKWSSYTTRRLFDVYIYEVDAVVNFGYVRLGYAFFGDLATIMT